MSMAGMAKVSDSRGGSSYKDLGLSLGGSSYKEINPVPEAARNRIQRPWPLNPVKLRRKSPDLAEISILASLDVKCLISKK